MPKKEKQVNRKEKWTANIRDWVRKPAAWATLAAVLLIGFLVISNMIRSRNAAQGTFQTVKLDRSDLVAIVGATGIVKANQTAELNWETTGRVESVKVAINEHVDKGQILAELADNTLPQSVILAQADLVDAQRELDNLVNSTTQSAQAYADLLQAEKDFNDADKDRDRWNYNNAGQARIDEARAIFIVREEDLKNAQSAYDLLADLPAEDAQKQKAKEKLDQARLDRDKALRNLNYILGKAYDRQVAEDYADYDLAFSKLMDAQREWERLKDGPDANDIRAAEARVAAAEATVSLGKIEAPFSGTVTLSYPKVGDLVASGTTAFRIDDTDRLFVEVEISEVDINKVKIGQGAELSFDAIPSQTYAAEVTEVSSVGTEIDGAVNFLVKLTISDPDNNVRPGMTAAVNIIVSEIKDILVVPNRAIRLQGGKRVVYVLKDGKPVPVEVKLGASSDVDSEIISGDLKVGDQIILNPPFEFSTNGGPPAFVRD